jgi:hypothetical protein
MSEILKVDNDYTIDKTHPYKIYKKGSKNAIKESVSKSNGYINCYLNKKKFLKHRLVAIQFIPNPNNLPEVDHKNRNITDFHVNNLHWVNRTTNMWNTKRN